MNKPFCELQEGLIIFNDGEGGELRFKMPAEWTEANILAINSFHDEKRENERTDGYSITWPPGIDFSSCHKCKALLPGMLYYSNGPGKPGKYRATCPLCGHKGRLSLSPLDAAESFFEA